MDYEPEDMQATGYYRVYFQRSQAPAGPFAIISALAEATQLREYPDDGYVVWSEAGAISNVPSLNPDDLV